MDDKYHEEALIHGSQRLWYQVETLNCYFTLMPHDNKKDTVFTDTNFKASLLKSMPLSWQNAYC